MSLTAKMFNSYPEVNEFFVTSDDQYFFSENNAFAHAKSLQDKTVTKVTRDGEAVEATPPAAPEATIPSTPIATATAEVLEATPPATEVTPPATEVTPPATEVTPPATEVTPPSTPQQKSAATRAANKLTAASGEGK